MSQTSMRRARPGPPHGKAADPIPAQDRWHEELIAWQEGYRCVAGIDEAGRGALAGPVVAACVVMPLHCRLSGINDSKLLSPLQRDRLYEPILRHARGVGIGVISAAEIDTLNILRATHQAMRSALRDLPAGLRPDLALIDGLPVRPFPVAQIALVGGDGRSISIGAASIVAKVTRDRLMARYAQDYPLYGFADHKGYGAPVHLAALSRYGPCELHRRSYRPVRMASEVFPARYPPIDPGK